MSCSPGQLSAVEALQRLAGDAARRSTAALLSMQHDQGYWWADLTADTTLESDYILLQLWLDPPVNGTWKPKSRRLIDKAATSILRRQLPDGGVNIYPQGPAGSRPTAKTKLSPQPA